MNEMYGGGGLQRMELPRQLSGVRRLVRHSNQALLDRPHRSNAPRSELLSSELTLTLVLFVGKNKITLNYMPFYN